MVEKLRRGATRNLPLLALLFAVLCVAFAQNGSLAYWNLPPERVDSLLLHVPAGDHDRYLRLRDEFAGLHCSPELMQKQPTGHQDGTNLICTLPGKGEDQIIVAARFERKGESTGAGGRWNEALMLPLLFNALQAQPRLHTFVFAALNGEAGEKAFFDPLRKKAGQPPAVLVVLDKIGLGTPSIYRVKPALFSKKSHAIAETSKLLESDAITVAGIMQLPNPALSQPSQTGVGRVTLNLDEVMGNSILNREYQTPSILIYSSADSLPPLANNGKHAQNHSQPPDSFTENPPAATFHRNFDFVASFLCLVDIKIPLSRGTIH
jgi:hypothetical protein